MSRHQKKTAKNRKASSQPISAQWRAWYVGKKPVLLFVVKFGLLIALLYGLLALPLFDGFLYAYLKMNAWSANAILNLLGQHTQLSEVTIQSPQFGIAIRRGCDAVEPTWLFCSAVLCFPALLARKFAGMLAGIVILQLLNLVRIVTLFWIGLHFPACFNSAHLEVWPMVFIAVAIGLFLLWRNWSEQPKIDAPA